MGMFQNCSKVGFNQVAANGVDNLASIPEATPTASPAPSTSSCTPQQAQKLRVLFIVDDSGSTRSDDSGASVRGTAALDFINQNLSNSNLTYNYSYFAANEGSWDFSSSAFTATAASPAPTQPFGAAAQAVTAVKAFVSDYNSSFFKENGTDYDLAFQYIQSLVTADEAANPGYNYAVIFMSDGQPNRGNTSSAALVGDVNALLTAAGSGRLTVSTLYFNSSSDGDAGESSLMQAMASAGMGQYVNAVTDSGTLNISSMIQDVIAVPAGACSQ